MNKSLFSHKTDNWATPKNIYKYFSDLGFIDPCPLKCSHDGKLYIYENENVYINPPYSDIKSWVDYAIELVKHNCNVVLLIPSRTDTIYFHKLMNSEMTKKLYFVKGRLHFNDSKECAPFPSVFIALSNYGYNKLSCRFIEIGKDYKYE